MPQNRLQRMGFALLTVIITVHAYVFYSLYVVNGTTSMEVNQTTSVLSAIDAQGGVYILVCFNFPFALLTQLFFIQPLVRTLFKQFIKVGKKKTVQVALDQ